jgi:predicted esterase
MPLHLTLQRFDYLSMRRLGRLLSSCRGFSWSANSSKLCLPICLMSLFTGTVQAAGSYYDGDFPASTTSFTQATLTVGGILRDVLIYHPAGVVSPPLLVLFTGTGGTLAYSLLDELGRDEIRSFADREGVVVAAPMPRLMTRGDWDNHTAGYYYWETATQEEIDSPVSSGANANPDLLFVQAIMDEAMRAYGANPDRVYFNGFSNGAFFSYFAAAVLHNRVAAFAETGGGLVLSKTTHGDPPCQPTPAAGNIGEVRTCSTSGWTPQTCVSSGAFPRPIAPSAMVAVPPGFLEANDDDDVVPFAHTCNLAHALTGKTEFIARVVHSGGRHIWNAGFLQNSWNFMKSKSRLNVPLNQVVEFYNTDLDNYFITANADEAAAIDGGSAGAGWRRTGYSFRSGGPTAVCRFYGSTLPGPNSHFYTVDAAECQGLKDAQFSADDPRRLTVKSWNFESLDFLSTPPTSGLCPSGTVPVYRAYNNGSARGVDSNHRITSSPAALQEAVARGWNNEGVVMCAPI